MRSCKLIGLLLLGALLISPCMAMAEEISIPAVEYDISGWEDIWREIQAETGGAAGGASVSDAIARIKEGNLDGLLDLGRIVGLFKEKLTEGVKGMLGIIAWRAGIAGAYGNDSGSRRQRRIRRAAYLRTALQRHDGGVSKYLHAVHPDDVRAVHGGYGQRE